jgi:hypothetical protein
MIITSNQNFSYDVERDGRHIVLNMKWHTDAKTLSMLLDHNSSSHLDQLLGLTLSADPYDRGQLSDGDLLDLNAMSWLTHHINNQKPVLGAEGKTIYLSFDYGHETEKSVYTVELLADDQHQADSCLTMNQDGDYRRYRYDKMTSMITVNVLDKDADTITPHHQSQDTAKPWYLKMLR